MIWKSLKEEWPYLDDEIWLRWTTDGVTYQEKVLHEKKIDQIECLGIPEWRPLDAPEWMTGAQQKEFENLQGNWQSRVNRVLSKDHDAQDSL